MQDVEKIIPSEDILLAWLAGIIDGEGTIGIYNRDKPKHNRIVNLAIVNSDEKIIAKVEEIYRHFGIYASKYLHNNKKPVGYTTHKPCYVIVVRRRDDFEKILRLLEPYLIGNKKQFAQEALTYLKDHPKIEKIFPICQYCRKSITEGRKRKFHNQDCWHEYAKGNENPNYRHGKYIARND